MNETLFEHPYILIASTYPPYSSSVPVEAIEAAMAASNVAKEVYFLLQGEGVLQLQINQNPAELEQKSMYKKLSAMPLFDIEHVFIDEAALTQFDIDITKAPASLQAHLYPVNTQQMGKLGVNAQHVLVF